MNDFGIWFIVMYAVESCNRPSVAASGFLGIFIEDRTGETVNGLTFRLLLYLWQFSLFIVSIWTGT